MVLASSLSGYEVMTTEGTELGVVESSTINPKTGDLQHRRLE
jgi:sporulation protein YlmC with PRC-barrel domain